MPSITENLKLARAICDEIKGKVTSSNDIFPQHDLFLESDGCTYQSRFSDERTNLWIAYHKLLQQMRRHLCDVPSHAKLAECIAITHFGIGECQELASLAFFKLLAEKRLDIALCRVNKTVVNQLFPQDDSHYFVIIGNQLPDAEQSINAFNHLPNHVIVLDPLLNYAGKGNEYVASNADYLTRNGYDHIVGCTPATPEHLEYFDNIKEQVKACFRLGFDMGYRVFDKAVLDTSIQKIACSYTPSHIDLLNAGSGLHFFAVRDEDYKVDAVCQINTSEEERIAEGLKDKFQTGSILKGKNERFFVLPSVNVDDERTSLPRSIYEAYK